MHTKPFAISKYRNLYHHNHRKWNSWVQLWKHLEKNRSGVSDMPHNLIHQFNLQVNLFSLMKETLVDDAHIWSNVGTTTCSSLRASRATLANVIYVS